MTTATTDYRRIANSGLRIPVDMTAALAGRVSDSDSCSGIQEHEGRVVRGFLAAMRSASGTDKSQPIAFSALLRVSGLCVWADTACVARHDGTRIVLDLA